ncbi:MAG: hypothetical protein QNJ62_06190 [Methyloceanibacter sp.]|nr:hypothetical protein [Methyloceanibacter sp.]
MPLIDLQVGPEDIGTGPRPDIHPKAPDPSLAETFGAAFRLENTIGSFIASQAIKSDPLEIEEGFDVGTFLKDNELEDFAPRFEKVFNTRSADAIAADIRREEKDRRTLSASGGMGIAAAMGAGIVDLPTLLPTGAAFSVLRGGASASRAALAVGAAAGLDASASEIALQSSQQLRTGTESAINIGGSILLGGLVGGAAAKIVGPKKYVSAGQKLERELANTDPDQGDIILEQIRRDLDAQPGGAAVVDRPTLEDLDIAGTSAKAIARSTKGLNPLLRVMQSPSARAREVIGKLAETSIYTNRNMAGEGEAAAETLAKEWAQGRVARVLDDFQSEWRKSDEKLTYRAFVERVGRASRRNDIDPGGNEAVSRAAQSMRRNLVEPGKLESIKLGLLPEDVKVSTADSYFTRVWNRNRLIAQEPQFKAITEQWLNEQIDQVSGDLASQFVSKADRDAYVKEIANSVFDKLTGRADLDEGETLFKIVPTKRGPLKERTFQIEDSRVEDFLEDDAEFVAQRYGRQMGGEIEISRKFGKPDMKDAIKEVKEEYRGLREATTTEKQRQKLDADERSDIRDISAIRDMMRGMYQAENNSTNYARVLQGVQAFNYMRAMGNVVMASVTDVMRPVMVHGLGRFMNDGLRPLMTNLKAIKMSAKEAKLAGAVAERVLNNRMATLADLNDPYALRSPFERMLDNFATTFSKATGIVHWNDFQKTFSSVITQNRILDDVTRYGAVKQKERAYLGFLGIDQNMAGRIARQFEEHGETLDGVRVANTELWSDETAVRIYRAAVNKDTDSIIVTKGLGDIPLFARTPTGRAILQFRSFALASHQRVLMRGMQEDATAFWTGAVGAAAMGAFVYWLRATAFDQEVSNNPGTWIGEGLDRSGIFSIAFEVNNAFEKLGGPGVFSGLSAAGRLASPGADARQPASRFASRGLIDGFLGPTVGLAKDLTSVGNSAFKADLTESDINTMRRLAPFASLPYIRAPLEHLLLPELKEAVSE